MHLERIVQQAGGTPLYVYDRHLIKERVRKLRSELPSELDIHYAVKANPMPAIIACLAPLVDGFDVASVGEMQSVLNFGARFQRTSALRAPQNQRRACARRSRLV